MATSSNLSDEAMEAQVLHDNSLRVVVDAACGSLLVASHRLFVLAVHPVGGGCADHGVELDEADVLWGGGGGGGFLASPSPSSSSTFLSSAAVPYARSSSPVAAPSKQRPRGAGSAPAPESSVPVNVPDWSKILGAEFDGGRKWSAAHDGRADAFTGDEARDPDLRHERHGRHRLEVGPASCRVGPAAHQIFPWTRVATWWVPHAVQCGRDWILAKISVPIMRLAPPSACGLGPATSHHAARWNPREIFASKLHLIYVVLFISVLFYLVQLGTYTALDLHLHREVWFLCYFTRGGDVPALQPRVLKPDTSRLLLLWRWIDVTVSTRVFELSFIYLRQRHQLHHSVVGIFVFNGSTDPPLTDAKHGQSIWVHASLTPLRIPHADRNVLLHALVDAAVFPLGLRTSMYSGLLLKTSL